jgi:hypothetical protein
MTEMICRSLVRNFSFEFAVYEAITMTYTDQCAYSQFLYPIVVPSYFKSADVSCLSIGGD